MSSAKFPGNFAALSGLPIDVADAACQNLAVAAKLAGSWKAWISDSRSSPALRLEHASVPYTLIDGTVVAPNWAGLTAGKLLHAIDKNEVGVTAPNDEVWTGTDAYGAASISGGGADFPIGDCGDFTSSTQGPPYTVVGLTSKDDTGWSYSYVVGCDKVLRLYCFEQN